MKSLDVFLVVGFVLMVLRKWHCRRCFVGNSPDLWRHTEFGKISKNAAVKIRDRQPIINRKFLIAAAARPHLKLVVFEIKLDLKISVRIRYRPCRQSAWADIQ